MVDAKAKLNAASSNKEYQALVEQIAAAEMAGSVLADEILEAMEKVDVQQLSVKEVEKGLAAGDQELDKTRQAIDGGRRFAPCRHRRVTKAAWPGRRALPADFKVDYQRVVRGKGANGMASVEDDVCGACGQQITLNMQNELRLAKPVFCKSCGCLLYLSE